MTNKQDMLDLFSNPIIKKDTSDPFANDEISANNELKIFAENLENLINKEFIKPKKDGLIISIYADWGLGKTTFVDVWGQSLISKDIVALKFNAWKCDHSNEPILPFMAEIKSQFNLYPEIAKKESFFKAIKDVAGKILSSASISIAGVSLDVGELFACLEQKKDVIEEFKKELKAVVDERPEKKLYIFIDELDRCNPLFAIKLLEIAKHLFDVKGICFILAINHESLVNTIERVYGLRDDLAGKYLEKFFDFQLKFPVPDTKKYAWLWLKDVMCGNYEYFDERLPYIDDEGECHVPDSDGLPANFESMIYPFSLSVFTACCEDFKSSLRDIEKQAKEIEFFLSANKKDMDDKKGLYVFLPIAVYFGCFRKKNKEEYGKICANEDALLKSFKTFIKSLDADYIGLFCSLLSALYRHNGELEILINTLALEIKHSEGYSNSLFYQQHLCDYFEKT